MKKVKIAFVLSMLGYGGTEAFVINVIRALNLEKYDVSIILALEESQKEKYCCKANIVEELGIKLYYVGEPNKGTFGVLKFYRRIKKCFKVFGPFDVVHSHMDFCNGIVLTAAKSMYIPTRVAHAHISSSQTELCSSFIKKILIKIYRVLMRKLILLNATDLCGCSKEANIFEYGRRNYEAAHCVYNGILLERYKKATSSRLYMQENFGVNKKNIVLTVGRVANVKNPWFMVEIVHQLSKLRDDFVFLWVGHNAYLDSFKMAVQEKGITEHFIFAGTRSDIPEIMKNSDCFILPSIFEGLGIVLIEAQASGLHCIVSNKVPRLADCGNCDFLDIEDVEAAKIWAARISDVLDKKINFPVDEKRMMKFDIDNTISQLMKIYEN